jgi:hypothetical protein
MTVSLTLPPDTEAKLRQRVAAAGQEVAAYLAGLVAREIDAPLSLAEAAEPFARAVDAAGVDDDELASLITQARDETRAARRTK